MKSKSLSTPIVLLTFFLTACGGDEGNEQICTPGTTQSCLCPGGSTGVQVCASDGSGWGACECTSPDTTTDPDAAPDVTPDPTPDTPSDTPTDTDPGDGCTGLTEPQGGVCNIVEQCGCMSSFDCEFQVDPATCEVIENCVAGATGTREPEAECTTAGQCRAGTSCLTMPGDSIGHCYEWCVTTSDCSVAGRECTVSVTFDLPSPCTGTGTVPYHACSLVTTCTSETDCLTGEICYDGVCDDPWGHTFDIVFVDGEAPYGDGTWDIGSLPDPFVEFTVDGLMCTSATIDDTYFPDWGDQVCTGMVIGAGNDLTLRLWDEDLTTHDLMVEATGQTITLDMILAGGITWTFTDGYVEFGIEWP